MLNSVWIVEDFSAQPQIGVLSGWSCEAGQDGQDT
jgi:hypothetical protein